MISHDGAVEAILATVKPRPIASVPVEEALGLALARPVKARLRMPRFDQSAMDGIAVRIDDLAGASPEAPARLELAGEIPAGSHERVRLRRGTAVKVFTGAAIPAGTEAVVMVEFCRFEGDQVFVERTAKPDENIRRAGEEVARGDTLLEAGTPITPPVIGLLSHFGFTKVPVRTRPSLGVITMGDEVAAPGAKLGPHQVHDANGPALRAALTAMGFDDVRSWHVDDRPRSLVKVLEKALGRCDVVITVGGASVGDHDHVKGARAELGVREVFSKVAIKPGKPNVFGMAGKVPVFSLPGNPVSALVSFHLYVRPALRRLLGLPVARDGETTVATLRSALKKKPGRTEWVRVHASHDGDGPQAERLAAQGSHMLTGLARSNALLRFENDLERADAGDRLALRWLDWGVG